MAGSSCNSRGFLYWRADRRSRRPDAEGRGSPLAKLSLSNSSVPGRTLFGREGPHGRTVRYQPADARDATRRARRRQRGRASSRDAPRTQLGGLGQLGARSCLPAGPKSSLTRRGGQTLARDKSQGQTNRKKIDVERRVAHEAAAGSWARLPLAAGFPRGPTGLHSGLLRARFSWPKRSTLEMGKWVYLLAEREGFLNSSPLLNNIKHLEPCSVWIL